jgi:hypothetical protein
MGKNEERDRTFSSAFLGVLFLNRRAGRKDSSREQCGKLALYLNKAFC